MEDENDLPDEELLAMWNQGVPAELDSVTQNYPMVNTAATGGVVLSRITDRPTQETEG
jgi:hypothetical protein